LRFDPYPRFRIAEPHVTCANLFGLRRHHIQRIPDLDHALLVHPVEVDLDPTPTLVVVLYPDRVVVTPQLPERLEMAAQLARIHQLKTS
jgi:hypothetical protein